MKRKVKIWRMDHTGHSCTAEFDPEVAESVKVAQDKLTEFLTECITQYGSCPPVFARRCGETEFTAFEIDRSDKSAPRITDNIVDVDEILLQYPLAGG